MSRAARIALVVVGAALVAVVGAIVWISTQGVGAEAAPIPGPGEGRTVVADPSVELPYLVEVPGGPDGCPGGTFRSPAEPLRAPQDGYAAVMLPSSEGAAVIVACIGALEESGSVEEFVADILSGKAGDEAVASGVLERDTLPTPLLVERLSSPHGDDIVLTSRVGLSLLADHYVERDGWVHAIGYLRREATGDVDRPVVDAILASWQWR